MNTVDSVWAVGRLTIQPLVKLFAPLRVYGTDRIPPEGGVVLALNHFSWIDPPAFGTACPRTIHYLAKSEIHRHHVLGQLIRAFGARSVRRGESDREAVRAMREIVREGHALGLFVEGTRQKNGMPGEAMPGAAMVALQEDVPVVPAAIYGSQFWKPGNFHPVSIAWGEPMRFEGIPRSGKGYREGSALIQEEIHRLWRWLGELHEQGRRPATATPPP
jgi:1-acyl-sn-glycerol-3-phosphate acyltransferase